MRPKQTCKTCYWAKWNRQTPAGRPKGPGICGYDTKLPTLPWAFTLSINRSGIWPQTGDTCPCWERKGQL